MAMQKPDTYKAGKSSSNKATRTLLAKEIRDGAPKQIYILSGEEGYLVKYYKNALIKAICGDDDMNFTAFNGKEFNYNEFVSIADTMPFFAERRLILLENTGVLSEASEEFESYLHNMPDTTCLLIVDSSIDKRLKVYKTASSLGLFVSFSYQSEEELLPWVTKKLSSSGVSVTEPVCRAIISRVGIDMNALDNELDKLISYVGDKKYVELSDLDAIGTENYEDKIFDIVESIVYKKDKKAMSLYENLLALKVPAIKMLIILAKQYARLHTVQSIAARGGSDPEIMKAVGCSSGQVYYLRKQASSVSASYLDSMIRFANDMDESIKSGNITDTLAVDMFISKALSFR